jgi:mitochondrial fission protein ELM1
MTEDQVRGRTGWIISDGKMGNDVQTRGVFDALGLDYQMKRIAPTKMQQWLAPYVRVGRSKGFASPDGPFTPPWPDFVISIGRLTTPYMRAMRGHAGFATYRIILQDPKVSLKTADLFWVPEHDRRRGPNVITTLTPPHSFSARRIADLRRTMPPEIGALPSPRVAVLLGGPHGTYKYSPEALAELVSALTSLASLGCGLMITPSRRTPPDFTAALEAATRGTRRVFWDVNGENP